MPARGVFSRARAEPAILARDLRVPDVAAVRDMQVAMGKLETERRLLLDALRDALDGWAARAGEDDLGRIEALRMRWGVQPPGAAPVG